MQELSKMVCGQSYIDTCMRGILYLTGLVEEYEKECIDRGGSSPVRQMDYRIKSAESIAKKLEKKGCGISCENARRQLSDLAGIRIVCESVEDAYKLQGFLTSRKDLRVIKKKDYIKCPKTNGYQSLHLITEPQTASEGIRVEVQIRTEEMHRWAQMDHELYYKN